MDGRGSQALLIGEDWDIDIAILQVAITGLAGIRIADQRIHVGDIVVAIDDEAVSGIRDLLDKITRHNPGERILVTIYRGADAMTLDMKVSQRP